MRIHRVFIKELADGEVVLTGAEALHLSRVLRVKPGQAVTAFDGGGMEAAGTVTSVEPDRLTLSLEPSQPADVESELSITVAIALLKGDKLADAIRQCTELGAVAFQPFVSRHADVRELAPRKRDRLQRVATEAAKQSGRALVPTVSEVVTSGELPDLFATGAVIYADPRAQMTLSEARASSQGEMAIVTGPEGGFAAAELESFAAAGFQGVRLGARILRAETAPVALLAALLLPEAL